MMKPILAVLLLAPLLATAAGSPSTAQNPPTPPPGTAPAIPAAPPAPPPEHEVAAAPQATVATPVVAAQGQWVYTQQYAWVWMPYAQSFTYLPTTGAAPQMYVYYPAVGWTWVVAPWVWGLGPQPYFGVAGTAHFVWWGSGFGHWYGFRGGYAAWGGRGYYAGGRWYVR